MSALRLLFVPSDRWTPGLRQRGSRFSLLACSCVLALIAAGSARALAGRDHGLGATESRVRSEPLPNAPGQSLTVVRVTYAPGGTSPRHHHAGSVLAVVLSGAVRSQNSATGPARVYRTGESFFEPAGSHHTISENASATEPAELLAIFVAPEGAQLTAADP